MAYLVVGMIIFGISIIAGITGLGGVLYLPVFTEILGMEAHVAAGTAFTSFILPGLFTAWLYSRQGNFDWNLALPMGLGGICFSYFGSALKASVSGNVIVTVLAGMVLVAGFNALRTPKAGAFNIGAAPLRTRRLFTFCLGGAVGFLAGLSGSGGAALLVPIMVYCGFPVAATVSASILYGVPSGISGSVANVMHGFIDYTLLLVITPFQLIGMGIGVKLVPHIPVATVKKMVAMVCIVTGLFLLGRVYLFPVG